MSDNSGRGTTTPGSCGTYANVYDEARALYGPIVLVADIMVGGAVGCRAIGGVWCRVRKEAGQRVCPYGTEQLQVGAMPVLEARTKPRSFLAIWHHRPHAVFPSSPCPLPPASCVPPLQIKRVATPYVLSNLLPVLIISLVVFVVFFLPCNALGERMCK